MSDTAEPILEFRDVTWGHDHRPAGAVPGCDVRAGRVTGIAGVDIDRVVELFDLAEGLLRPTTGTVCFCGRDWEHMGPAEGNRQRAAIGRTFAGRAWMSNLSVLENLLLAPMFHGGREIADVMREIEHLLSMVGVPEVPPVRPHELSVVDSRVMQWVRAFLGSRRLVLLEFPAGGVPSDRLAGLTGLVNHAVENGAAVVWATPHEEDWKPLGLIPARRLEWRGGQWMTGGGA